MTLAEELSAEISREIELIMTEAEHRIDEIISGAKKSEMEILANAQNETAILSERILTGARGEAELEARSAVGAEIERLLLSLKEKAFIIAGQILEKDYATIVASFFANGSAVVGSPVVDADLPLREQNFFSSNEKQIRGILTAKGITLRTIQHNLNARGGCIIYSSDHRRACTMTFEESFRRIEESIREELIMRLQNEK